MDVQEFLGTLEMLVELKKVRFRTNHPVMSQFVEFESELPLDAAMAKLLPETLRKTDAHTLAKMNKTTPHEECERIQKLAAQTGDREWARLMEDPKLFAAALGRVA